jgi:hypothetical protein
MLHKLQKQYQQSFHSQTLFADHEDTNQVELLQLSEKLVKEKLWQSYKDT